MNLKNTKYGYKQRLVIGGINSWDNLISKSLNLVFFIEILDSNDVMVEDKTIVQHRRVIYNLNNSNKVNNQFDPVKTGGTGEYDFFMNYLSTNKDFFGTLSLLQLKLNERGIFD